MNGNLNTPKLNNKVSEISKSFETILRLEVAAVVNGEELKQKRITRELETIEVAITGFGGLKGMVNIRMNELAEAWRNEPVTEKQISFIKSMGGSVANGITKGTASDLIEVLKDVQSRTDVIRRRAADFQNLVRNAGIENQPSIIASMLAA